MKEFSLDNGDFDLELTMTCGQTFCWHRIEGTLYEDGRSHFYTFRDDKPIIVEEKDGNILVQTELSREEVEKALGLDRDLNDIFSNS